MVTSPRAGLFLRDMPVNPLSDKEKKDEEEEKDEEDVEEGVVDEDVEERGGWEEYEGIY